MNHRITASYEELQLQSVETASLYLRAAKNSIDVTFGKDYAFEHPELVAAFMRVAATDMAIAVQVEAYQSRTVMLEEKSS